MLSFRDFPDQRHLQRTVVLLVGFALQVNSLMLMQPFRSAFFLCHLLLNQVNTFFKIEVHFFSFGIFIWNVSAFVGMPLYLVEYPYIFIY